MKNKGFVILGLISILVIFLGIKLVINDFYFIDGLMIIPMIALPISLILHYLGVVIQKTLKVKYTYLITFLVYILGVSIVIGVNNFNDIFDGGSGFILLFILYPSFICHLSIVAYYIYFKKNTNIFAVNK